MELPELVLQWISKVALALLYQAKDKLEAILNDFQQRVRKGKAVGHYRICMLLLSLAFPTDW